MQDNSLEIQSSKPVFIQVIEEQLHIDKKVIETGKVLVSKKIIENNFDADMPLSKQEIIIERKPVELYIDGDMPGVRFEGDVTIIPVVKEVMVKRLLLVEEIYIIKRQTEVKVPIHEVLRKEEVTITRTGSPATGEEQ